MSSIRRVEAELAVVALRTRMAGSYAGVSFSGTARYTRVWAREDGGWRIVAGHVSVVPIGAGASAPADVDAPDT